MSLVTTEELRYWEHFFSLCNLMYRTIRVPLNSTRILAHEQFGSIQLHGWNFMSPEQWMTLQWLSLWTCQTFLTMNHDSRIKAKWYGYENNSGLHFLYVLWGGNVSLTSNTQPGGSGYPFWSGSSRLTYLANDAVPIPSLPSAQLSGSFDHTIHTTASK